MIKFIEKDCKNANITFIGNVYILFNLTLKKTCNFVKSNLKTL